MIRGANLSEDVGVRLDEDDLAFLPEELADTFSRSEVRAGDLVFTCWGTVGQIGMIEPTANFNRYIISNKQMKMTPDPEKADSRYLYYYLSQKHMVDLVRSQAIGSSVPGFNLGQLRMLPVEIPSIARQREVAEVLGALDDKIVGNANLIGVSALLASTIFDSLLGNANTTSLIEVAKFVNGRAFTKNASGFGRVVIRIAELNSGLGASTVRSDIEVADDHISRPGDLLFAWSGSLTVQRWFRAEAIVNQHIFKVIPHPDYPTWLVHQVLLRKLEEFQSIAADKATTMGHIQRRHLDEPVMIPSREGIERQHVVMDGLWHTALSAEQESLKLQELRDTLLPQLMSGKLRVGDAEKQVEEVL